MAILEQEGIEFVYDTDVGRDVTAAELQERFDALVIATGSRVAPRPRRAGPRAWPESTRDGLPVSAQPLGRRVSEGRPVRAPEPGTEITAAARG